MSEVTDGIGPMFSDPDPDAAREFFRTKKVGLSEKLMTVSEAVARFVTDGCYLASGGFGTNRIATAVLHEIVRAGKRDLAFAGHTATHDFQILAAGNRNGRRLLAKVDAAYIVGLEARGLSPQARRMMESSDVEVCEWTNYAMACRFRAAASGVPYIPMRSMAGTDTMMRSAAKTVICPFTAKKLVAVPALYPDVSVLHVHEADSYGNCRIYGITAGDLDMVRASKRVIVSAERIIDNESVRTSPHLTVIPSLYVDAVCEVPFGSYPGNMPGEYFSDEVHLKEWLDVEKDDAAYDRFLNVNLYGVSGFDGYLDACGARGRLDHLMSIEKGGSE